MSVPLAPAIPTAQPVPESPSVNIPTAAPVRDDGAFQFPELAKRPPTRTESALLSGESIAMGSSNVDEIWFNGAAGAGPVGTGRLFVKFLDGSTYVYHDVPLAVAVGMVQTDSPGRYVWNKLRDVYRYELRARGTGQRRGPQVVRSINK
jgi:hypothetical protein